MRGMDRVVSDGTEPFLRKKVLWTPKTFNMGEGIKDVCAVAMDKHYSVYLR